MKEILQLMQQHYQKWEQDPQRKSSGYAYEKSFTEMWLKLGQEVLQQSIGTLPKSKNIKKNFRPLGGK